MQLSASVIISDHTLLSDTVISTGRSLKFSVRVNSAYSSTSATLNSSNLTSLADISSGQKFIVSVAVFDVSR